MESTQLKEFNLIRVCVESPDCLEQAIAKVTASDFYHPVYRDMYSYCIERFSKGETVDPANVITKNEDWYKVMAVSPDVVPMAANVSVYINEVLEASRLRKIQRTANEIAKTSDCAEADRLTAKLEKLANHNAGGCILKPYLYTCADFMKELEERKDIQDIPTGFECLDRQLNGGLHPGVYVLGGMSGTGKTTFALQMACNIAQSGKHSLFYTLEQSPYELVAKIFSRFTYELSGGNEKGAALTASQISSRNKYKYFTKEQHSLIRRAIEEYEKIENLIHWQEGNRVTTIVNIANSVRQQVKQCPAPLVVFIDYLQIIPDENQNHTDKQKTDQAVTELRQLARDMKLPVVVISSLNRTSYSQKLTLGSFKESGSIEYSADVAVALDLAGITKDNRAELMAKDPREIEADFLKNRNGAVDGKAQFKFYPAYSCYIENKEVQPVTQENTWERPA